jgi:hypothetical protein
MHETQADMAPVDMREDDATSSVDVSALILGNKGDAYAHEYDAWLAFFKQLACATRRIYLENVPVCWEPFVRYMGHEVGTVRIYWRDADALAWGKVYESADDRRRVVEMASVCRPELVHALYCYDTEWPTGLRAAGGPKRAFVVTCNGSFFRPEVQAYRARLRAYVPPVGVRAAVLVPCAAAKPYPAPLHRAVQARLPDPGWEVVIATGVLGLIPSALWADAPEYDSGVPYLDRVEQTVRWYFTRHAYEHVVVYSDFYAYAIRKGIESVPSARRPRATYVFGAEYRDTYENTNLIEHLDRLEIALHG